MKTFVLLLSLLIISIPLKAQTKSSRVFSSTQKKYENLEKTGTVLTAAGGIALLYGNIMYWKIYNTSNHSEPNENKATTYKHLMIGALGVLAVGIPLWAIGRTKLKHIEIEARVVRFNNLASANGIGLRIMF